MRSRRRTKLLLSVILLICCGPLVRYDPVMARVLEVGAGHIYAVPSAAAAVAEDGDTVTIAPGDYYDCAVWNASRLTIVGSGADAVITDHACAGKAAFVFSGAGVVVRGLVFQRVRVAEGNGAGIRAEGGDLTVEDSRFVNNQFGILAGDTGGILRVRRCIFSANGISLDGRATHAVSAGRLAVLDIEHSTFEAARGGDHIASAAIETELLDNRLVDEGGSMTGPLVTVFGGALRLQGNTLVLAEGSADRPGAVLVFGAVSIIEARGNILVEPSGHVPMLRNWTGVTASEEANTVPANAVAISDSGTAYHRLRSRVAGARDLTFSALVATRHQVAALARKAWLIP